MKKFVKALCALGLCAAMVLPASAAYTPKNYDPLAHMKNAAINPVQMVSLPEFRGLERMTVKSSIVSPEADTGALFDVLPDTAATLTMDESGKATVSFAGEKAYILKKLVLDKTDSAYSIQVYGSNDVDQVNWVALDATAAEYDSDTYAVYDITNKTEYFYYRVEITADADVTLHSILPYGKTLKPHDLYWGIFGGHSEAQLHIEQSPLTN